MPIRVGSTKPVSFLCSDPEPEEPEVDVLALFDDDSAVPDATPIIGDDLQYILDQYEDEEITKDELIRQAVTVGYTAEEIEQILEG
jgi:hypothetical protein